MGKRLAGILIPLLLLTGAMTGMAAAYHLAADRPEPARKKPGAAVSSRPVSAGASGPQADLPAYNPYESTVLHPYVYPKPEGAVCQAAQKRAFAGLSGGEIQTLKDTVHGEHLMIENNFVHKSLWTRLGDPQSICWAEWERLGEIEYPGSEPFSNTRDGDTIVAALQKAAALEKDALFHADFVAMEDLVRRAVQNHDLSLLVRYHRMIHDMDYWVVGYPVSYLDSAPPDWAGVNCYFGTLTGLPAVDSAGAAGRKPQ